MHPTLTQPATSRQPAEASSHDPHIGPAFVNGNLRGHLAKGAVRLVSLLAVDVLALLSARWILRSARKGSFGDVIESYSLDVFPAGALSGGQLILALLAGLLAFGCYQTGDHWRDPVRVLAATGAGVLLALYSDLWHGNAALVLLRGVIIWLSIGGLVVAARAAASAVSRRFAEHAPVHRVIEVIGEGDLPFAPSLGVSYVTVGSMKPHEVPTSTREMEQWIREGVDTIIVAGDVPPTTFGTLTDFALTHGCRLLSVPRVPQLVGVDTKRVWIDGQPVLELTAPGLRASQLVLKRALDITFASMLLLALSPLLLVVAVWVRLESPGPVIFRQPRPGFQGRTFEMLKFRSMRTDAEEVLHANEELYELFLQNDCKLPEDIDPRLTRPGRLLRKTSLDEFPQLWNVLRGEMSIVGPRPLVGPELENYGTRIPTLLSVKPGMTGLWQVSGRSSIGFPERAELDLEYVRRWSFLRDLWILALTPPAVLLRIGAH